MASEWARLRADGILRGMKSVPEAIAAALDEARAEGERIGEERAAATIRENVMTAKHAAERERWECHRIAAKSAARIGADSAEQVRYDIAARGPMRGPEEG